MKRKEHLTAEGLRKIVSIKASINKGSIDSLKDAYPGIIPMPPFPVTGIMPSVVTMFQSVALFRSVSKVRWPLTLP